MTSDLDIYRTASVLIREHGENAALEAAQRADAPCLTEVLLATGSPERIRPAFRALDILAQIARLQVCPLMGWTDRAPRRTLQLWAAVFICQLNESS